MARYKATESNVDDFRFAAETELEKRNRSEMLQRMTEYINTGNIDEDAGEMAEAEDKAAYVAKWLTWWLDGEDNAQ